MATVVELVQIEFSPDQKHLFAVGKDGSLWITPLHVRGSDKSNAGLVDIIRSNAEPEWRQISTPTK